MTIAVGKRGIRLRPLLVASLAILLLPVAQLGSPRLYAQFRSIINVPPDPAPAFAGNRTQVNVRDGGQLGNSFIAKNASEINLFGGAIGNSFAAQNGSRVNISGGAVGSDFTATGGLVSIIGGAVADGFQALGGATITMSGGSVQYFSAVTDSQLDFSGGTIGSIYPVTNSTVNMAGGSIQFGLGAGAGSVINQSGGAIASVSLDNGSHFTLTGGDFVQMSANQGSIVDIRGGTFGDTIFAQTGSHFTLYGGEFLLDGQPVAGLNVGGDSVAINLTTNKVVSGTLADGTPFAMLASSVQAYSPYSSFPSGVLRLQKSAIPPVGPAVIHVPTDPVPLGIRHGQSLIVDAGGVVGRNFTAAKGSAVEIRDGGMIGENFEAVGAVVNVTGGTIASGFNPYSGTTVNISGGTVSGNVYMQNSSVNVTGGIVGPIGVSDGTANISGGKVGGIGANGDSVVTITGGVIGFGPAVGQGATMRLMGGSLGDQFYSFTAKSFEISGCEFRLNGVPIAGLDTIGSSLALNVSNDAVLSGTLSDGTPFAFANSDRDNIADGTLTLRTTSLPQIGPATVNAVDVPLQLGVRQGQTFVAAAGANVSDNFNAGRGSTVNVEPGATIGVNFEAVHATVNVSGGTVSNNFDALDGSTVNIAGGTVGDQVDVVRSTVNVTGGTVGVGLSVQAGGIVNILGGKVLSGQTNSTVAGLTYFDGVNAFSGSEVNIAGGAVGQGFDATAGSTVNISGGSIASGFTAYSGSSVRISGGSFGDGFLAQSGSHVDIYGADFRIDGVPVAGLDTPGSAVPVSGGCCTALSLTLTDGTPFNFLLGLNNGDYFYPGTLTLHATAVPNPGPALIVASRDPVPNGIRAGQTLIVDDGGIVGDNFQAGWGSTVLVKENGTVGDNLEAIGAIVKVTGGHVGAQVDVAFTRFDISGGFVDHHIEAFDGSVVNISGGEVGGFIDANQGSVFNVTGGKVAGVFNVFEGAVLNVSGGEFSFERFEAFSGGAINLFGRSFLLDGLPISDLSFDHALAISPRDVVLSGILADGTPFEFLLGTTRNFRDPYIQPGVTITVTLASVPEPSTAVPFVLGIFAVSILGRRGYVGLP